MLLPKHKVRKLRSPLPFNFKHSLVSLLRGAFLGVFFSLC